MAGRGEVVGWAIFEMREEGEARVAEQREDGWEGKEEADAGGEEEDGHGTEDEGETECNAEG